jgi:hypothetical protein
MPVARRQGGTVRTNHENAPAASTEPGERIKPRNHSRWAAELLDHRRTAVRTASLPAGVGPVCGCGDAESLLPFRAA